MTDELGAIPHLEAHQQAMRAPHRRERERRESGVRKEARCSILACIMSSPTEVMQHSTVKACEAPIRSSQTRS
jgi:hypothetical protein